MNEFDYKGWVNGNIGGQAPSSSDAEGHKGQIAFDENYIYVCVDENSWKRAALTTF